MRHALMGLLGAVLVLGVALASLPSAAAQATPVRQPAIWVDGDLYGTVLTPATFKGAAPDHSFDALYNFDNSGLMGQRSVSEAAPGDPDYNGGRWMVFAVTFTDLGMSIHDPGGDGMVDFELTSEEQVLEHAALGHLVISEEPVTLFECPLLPLE